MARTVNHVKKAQDNLMMAHNHLNNLSQSGESRKKESVGMKKAMDKKNGKYKQNGKDRANEKRAAKKSGF